MWEGCYSVLQRMVSTGFDGPGVGIGWPWYNWNGNSFKIMYSIYKIWGQWLYEQNL